MRNTIIRRFPLDANFWREAARRLEGAQVFDLSYRGEEANQVGVLGEVVFEQWLVRNQIAFLNQTTRTDFDYAINSFTVDVKTKDRTVPPKNEYDCSIPLYNHDFQKPNFYVFISLERDSKDSTKSIERFKTAYILGGIDQDGLESLGWIWKLGEKDPTNGTVCKMSCINIKMGDLIPPREMIDIFSKPT